MKLILYSLVLTRASHLGQPDPPPPSPPLQCMGNRLTFVSTYGGCSTYSLDVNHPNQLYCNTDTLRIGNGILRFVRKDCLARMVKLITLFKAMRMSD